MPDVITYPPSITSDVDKYAAVCRIEEEMRLESNRVGAIASASFGKYGGKWQTYRKLFKKKSSLVTLERARLRVLIRDANYSKGQWKSLEPDEREDAILSIMGDRHSHKLTPTLASSYLLNELKSLDLDTLSGSITDPYEDFAADYTENDAHGWLTVTQYKITGSDAFDDTSEIGCVYKDMGAGGIDAIDCLFEEQVGSSTNAPSNIVVVGGVAFAQELTQGNDWDSGVGFITGVGLKGTNTWRAYSATGAYDDTDYYNGISNDTTYYPNVVRESGADGVTYYLYSDSARTTLADTMALTGLSGQTWQYQHGINHIDWTDTCAWYGFIENLDMQSRIPRHGFVIFQDPGIV